MKYYEIYYDTQMIRGKFPFLVTVPQMPGCMTDERTYEEAVINANIIISEWIDTAKKQ